MNIILWHRLLAPYELAVQELVLKLNHIRKEYAEHNLYCPIHEVVGRVKSISSIMEKVNRKNIPMEKLEEQIEDIAGIRITCQFQEDIDQIVQMIDSRSDMIIKQKKDYIMHHKESGYRSYHLIVYYTVETYEGIRRVQAELQIRTMAMDFWATIEHSLQYKYKEKIPPQVRERLAKAADAVVSLDNEMSAIREEIVDAQLSSQMKYRLVSDILNTIENLYPLANEREIKKIQNEFYQIYSLSDMDELRHFHEQLDIIAEGYRAQSVQQGDWEGKKYR